MKRLLLLAALGMFALAIPVGVSAADDPLLDAYNQTVTSLGGTAANSLGGADVAVGNGVSCRFAACESPREFQFGAASSINGGVAGGVYSQTLTLCVAPDNCQFGTFRAHVECVSADANVAVIGGTVFQSDFTLADLPNEGDQVRVTAYDNGRNGMPAPDQLSFIRVDEPLLQLDGQCLDPPDPPIFTVFDGDIMVRDGQLVGNP
jgi:hypothetical protein